MKPVLEARQLSKRYPGGPGPALDSVTFSVDRGEFVGIMGASGSGKDHPSKCPFHHRPSYFRKDPDQRNRPRNIERQ